VSKPASTSDTSSALRTSSPAPTIRIKARDTSKTTRRLRTRSRAPPDVLEPSLKTSFRRVEAERRAGASPKKKLEKRATAQAKASVLRSEEHTSELQSRGHLVCRLLL